MAFHIPPIHLVQLIGDVCSIATRYLVPWIIGREHCTFSFKARNRHGLVHVGTSRNGSKVCFDVGAIWEDADHEFDHMLRCSSLISNNLEENSIFKVTVILPNNVARVSMISRVICELDLYVRVADVV